MKIIYNFQATVSTQSTGTILQYSTPNYSHATKDFIQNGTHATSEISSRDKTNRDKYRSMATNTGLSDFSRNINNKPTLWCFFFFF